MTRTPDFPMLAIAGAVAVLWGMTLLFGDVVALPVLHYKG